jgi:hypothetical protein
VIKCYTLTTKPDVNNEQSSCILLSQSHRPTIMTEESFSET